jgi:hypothetical protein
MSAHRAAVRQAGVRLPRVETRDRRQLIKQLGDHPSGKGRSPPIDRQPGAFDAFPFLGAPIAKGSALTTVSAAPPSRAPGAHDFYPGLGREGAPAMNHIESTEQLASIESKGADEGIAPQSSKTFGERAEFSRPVQAPDNGPPAHKIAIRLSLDLFSENL